MLKNPNQQLPDADPAETQEWMDSLQSVVRDRGMGGRVPASHVAAAGSFA